MGREPALCKECQRAQRGADFARCLYRPRRSVANNPSFVYAFYLAYAWLVTEALVLEVSLMADVYRPPFALF